MYQFLRKITAKSKPKLKPSETSFPAFAIYSTSTNPIINWLEKKKKTMNKFITITVVKFEILAHYLWQIVHRHFTE